MADYLPKREGDLVIWFNDHAAGVQTHGTTVGMSAAEKAQTLTDAATVEHAVEGRQLIDTDREEWTAYKDILLYAPLNTPLPGTPTDANKGTLGLGALAAIIARTRQMVERIKNHPAYTEAIGADLGVIAPAPPPPGLESPDLEGEALTGFQVRLTWAMLGHDSVEIQSKRGSEPGFTMITIDTNSPYIDARDPLVANQPEDRQYRAQYRDDDNPNGPWSPIITVTAHA